MTEKIPSNDEIIAMIPSKTMREYLTKINWQFSEREPRDPAPLSCPERQDGILDCRPLRFLHHSAPPVQKKRYRPCL